MVRFGLCALVMCVLVATAQATPEAHTWRRETMLGGNEREHLYLAFVRGNSGNAYLDFDSVFVYERSNTDPRWTQRTLIRASRRSFDLNTNQATVSDGFVAAFDLGQFLVDHNCNAAYFDGAPDSVAIDSKGMYYHQGARRSYFMTDAEIASWANFSIPGGNRAFENRRIVGAYQTTAVPDTSVGPMVYLLVRSGWGMDDAGEVEALVPVPRSAIDDARNKVRTPTPAKKPRGVKK